MHFPLTQPPPWRFTVRDIEPPGDEFDHWHLPKEKEMTLCRPDNFCLYRSSFEHRPDDDGKWFTLSINKEETELTLEFWGRERDDYRDGYHNPWHHVILIIPKVDHSRLMWSGISYYGEPIVYKHTVHVAVGVYAVMMDIPLSDIGGKS